jgi:hypothetical protein
MITRLGESPSPTLRYHVMDAKEGTPQTSGKRSPGAPQRTGCGGSLLSERFRRVPLIRREVRNTMIKWNYRVTRIALALGAIAAFAIASGAQTKWM